MIEVQAPVPKIKDFFLREFPNFNINIHRTAYKIAPIAPSSNHICKTLL